MTVNGRTSGRLAGRVAIVTGGSRGIGHAIARGYLREGASVVLTSRHGAEANAAADRLAHETGQSVIGFAADVSSEPAVDDMLERAQSAFGAGRRWAIRRPHHIESDGAVRGEKRHVRRDLSVDNSR